jgi:hypothetical protein
MTTLISQYIDHLSTTQLYTAIVAATVGLCIVLLGPGGDQNLPRMRSPRSATTPSAKQQPKWYLFKYINVGVFSIFIMSVAVFLWNASTYIHNGDRMTQFLVGWSLCLCYFFGFFGVFFIHQDIHNNNKGEEEENQYAVSTTTKANKGV